jgi:phenylalanyl-tRNA synthetase alpha chain
MTRRAIEERLTALGFTIEYGHELVTTHENFETTNIPMTHPATDIHDTFYVDKTNEEGEKLLLRTQTTAHQQEMLRKYGPVCKVAIP